MMPSGYTTFDICLAGRCVKAGEVASFGSRNSSTISQAVHSSTHRLREVDVTDLVEKQGWGVEDNLQAVLTKSLVSGLPTPVIIRRKFQGRPGEVQVPRGQTLEDYGDLLDSYKIIDGLKGGFQNTKTQNTKIQNTKIQNTKMGGSKYQKTSSKYQKGRSKYQPQR